jgi:light-regulated signal transduction histidine kinase (bacteriophytochrome)
LLRAEHQEIIDWGGDPNKPVSLDGERLSPRGSFALWRETVRLRALPWEPWILDAADHAIKISQADFGPTSLGEG